MCDEVQTVHCYRTAAQGGAAESVRTLHVDDSTVLKLAIGPSLAAVAVTTFHGLYLADFSSASGSPGTCLALPRRLVSCLPGASGPDSVDIQNTLNTEIQGRVI